MNSVWDIVKKVGAGIISNVVPGGSAIVSVINGFLPDDKKLPETATGSQAMTAIASLPPEQQVIVMSKQLEVDITQIKEENSTLRAMFESDNANPQSTRPKIALRSFNLVGIVTLVIISGWLYGVLSDKKDLVISIVDGWPFVGALLAPFVTVLLRYFGSIQSEHKNKLDAANGVSNPAGIAGAVSGMFSKK